MEKSKKVQKSSVASSSTTVTPSPKHPGPSAASTKPRASSKVAPPDAAESDDEGELTQGAKLGRLRRLCERKPSGKLNVPLEVHQKWLEKGRARDELLEQFEESEWNPDRDW